MSDEIKECCENCSFFVIDRGCFFELDGLNINDTRCSFGLRRGHFENKQKECCENCRFGVFDCNVESNQTTLYECHKKSPCNESWPVILSNEWCGEYEEHDRYHPKK